MKARHIKWESGAKLLSKATKMRLRMLFEGEWRREKSKNLKGSANRLSQRLLAGFSPRFGADNLGLVKIVIDHT
jgi:hypothetical protein